MYFCTQANPVLLSRFSLLIAVCATGYFAFGRTAISQTKLEVASPTEDTNSEFEASPNHSGLQMEANTIDFGRVFEGRKVTCPLKMTNTAGHPIKVVDVSASCGCTTIESEPSFVLQPGEQKAVTIQLNTANNVGSIEKRVTVYVREQQHRFKFPIALKAHSIPLVNIDKRDLDFGMAMPGETKTQEVTISVMHEHAETPPVYVAATPAGVQAVIRETIPENNAVRQWQLAVSINGDAVPEESIDGDIVLMTPSTVESVVRIPVRALQHSYVHCNPARMNLGAIRSGLVKQISLDCHPGHQFNVESCSFDGPRGVTVSYDPEALAVRVHIAQTPEHHGFLKGAVIIRYTCDNGPRQRLTIPVTGYRIAASR